MSNKRMYRRVDVKQVAVATLLDTALVKGTTGTTVGLDVAKAEIVVVVRWPDGSFERPWSVSNPWEIGLLIELLLGLKETCRAECSGTTSTIRPLDARPS